ncbi:hypothetical protein O181_048976 [Austropuccinia psidii MF-1]|uniref:Uncharacterized protein n=1 Tax=Austropuccinia psidii MF-1 TaxID=1389203 RepID=A0A9Q3HKX4_9BASI|nr:hypothetical protein [Austropuccinia psidii MF-1]
MENCSSTDFILGNDYLMLYGIDSNKNKDRYLKISDNKLQKYALLPFIREIKVNKASPVSLELEKFKPKQINEAEESLHITDKKENELSTPLYDQKKTFTSDKEPLGEIVGHEFNITLNIEKPSTPALRRPAYPESPRLREDLKLHIKELLDLVSIEKVGHNEEVEITTPVIVSLNN